HLVHSALTVLSFLLVFFPVPATPSIYTLSLHDALPIFLLCVMMGVRWLPAAPSLGPWAGTPSPRRQGACTWCRWQYARRWRRLHRPEPRPPWVDHRRNQSSKTPSPGREDYRARVAEPWCWRLTSSR